MKMNVPKEFFDEVVSDFMSIDGSGLDPKIRDVVMRWKTSPLLHKICPRWSCQGHSNKNRDSDFEIIFVTQHDGAEVLYEISQEITSSLVAEFGLGMLASTTFSVVNLKHRNHEYAPHVVVGIMNHGDEDLIDLQAEYWNKIINLIESGDIL